MCCNVQQAAEHRLLGECILITRLKDESKRDYRKLEYMFVWALLGAKPGLRLHRVGVASGAYPRINLCPRKGSDHSTFS